MKKWFLFITVMLRTQVWDSGILYANDVGNEINLASPHKKIVTQSPAPATLDDQLPDIIEIGKKYSIAGGIFWAEKTEKIIETENKTLSYHFQQNNFGPKKNGVCKHSTYMRMPPLALFLKSLKLG